MRPFTMFTEQPGEMRRDPFAALVLSVVVCLAFFVAWGPGVSFAGTDACQGDYCLWASGTNVCDATAQAGSAQYMTDYHGYAAVDFKYRAINDWDDFFAIFEVDNDGYECASASCRDNCKNTLTCHFFSQRDTTTHALKVTVDLSGDHSCNDVNEKTLYIIRPKCPSSISLDPLETFYTLDRGFTISGTVVDGGCLSSSVWSSNSVDIWVNGPNVVTSHQVVGVSCGSFSAYYTFPFPKLMHYGTYTVTVDYNGSNNDHPLDPSTATGSCQLDMMILIPSIRGIAAAHAVTTPPAFGSSSAVLVGGIGHFPGKRADRTEVHVIPVEEGIETGVIDLSPALPTLGRGIEMVPDLFGGGGGYELMALSREGTQEIVFANFDGEPVHAYTVQVPQPWGIAYDGQELWIASNVDNGPIRRVHIATGAPIRQILPNIGRITDIAWDGATQTLLALSDGRSVMYRIDPANGTIMEELPLRSAEHRGVATQEASTFVEDDATSQLYLYGILPGPPGTPANVRIQSTDPHTVRLSWNDPDQVPSWTEARIYRDGSLLTTVQPGAQVYDDGGLAEHSWHSYFLTAYRADDGVEGARSDTVATYAGGRPPRTVRVPQDYSSIQLAVFASASDDTVLVGPGTYGGGIDFLGRDICVMSESGPASTVIDGPNYPFSLVAFDSTEGVGAILSGFTLRGGTIHRDGVIHCGPYASPTIENCVIEDNEIWREGGLIVCEGGGGGGGGAPAIRNNTIAFNRLMADTLGQFAGGAITCRNANARISGNIIAFTDNGCGVWVEGAAPTLSCNDVWENERGAYRGCSAGAHDIAADPRFCSAQDRDLHLCATSPCLNAAGCGRIGALGQGCGACGAPIDYADHDAGNARLTVTDRGIVGFMDGTHAQGSGFVYPRSGQNILYVGSLWVGASPTYVANRDYDADPAREWVVASDPDGHVWVEGAGNSDQDIHAGFTDGGATQPRGLSVRQESWAFHDAPNDDYVIVRYFIENHGAQALSGLYAGLFMDLDLGDYTSNRGGVDPARHLVYMTNGADTYAGVRQLQGVRPPDGDVLQDLPANLTLIRNSTFVWQNQYILDADKFALLAASDPQHVLTDGAQPDDYGLLASVGPFALAPGQMREIDFAVLGGSTLQDLQANADAAQIKFLFPADVSNPSGGATFMTRLLPNAPNPFRTSTAIHFELARVSDVRLEVFDAGGRLVRRIAAGPQGPGTHLCVWNGRDQGERPVGSGVYFVRLCAPGVTDRRTIVLAR